MGTFEQAKEKLERADRNNPTEVNEALMEFGIQVIDSLCVNCKHYYVCPAKIDGVCINRCRFFALHIE